MDGEEKAMPAPLSTAQGLVAGNFISAPYEQGYGYNIKYKKKSKPRVHHGLIDMHMRHLSEKGNS